VALAPGQWYHIAIVSDNLQVTLYLNGQQQATFAAAGAPPINSFPLVLGGSAYGDGTMLCCGFPGSFAPVSGLGPRAPTDRDYLVATKLLSGSEAGLIADWPLDDGQGQSLHDIGPNHLTLALVNFNLSPMDWYPDWMRTEIVDGGPYFRVQRLIVPPFYYSGAYADDPN